MTQDMQKLMDEFAARFEASVQAQQNALKDAQGQFEATLRDAQEKLEAATVASDDNADTEPSANTTPPAAAWISAPDGEQMMVLNQEAVVMFMAIFDRVAQVAESLQKLGKK